MEIRDEMQKGKGEWRITHLPVHERLNYATAPPATLKKKYRSKSAIIQTKLKFQNYLDN